MLTRILVLTVSLTFYSGSILHAQKSPPKGKISAAEILDKHFAAIGGLEALRAMQTLHAHGRFSFSVFNRIGDFHFYYKAPTTDLFQLDSISEGQSSVGHNEGAPFFKRAGLGIWGVNGVSLDVLEANWIGLVESAFNQNYKRIELVGLNEVDGKWAYALRFTPKLGDPQVRYYDCQSFLMVRMDLLQRVRTQKDGPESAYKVETYYSDYRDWGGINFPRKISASASQGELVLDIQDVRTNAPVKDSVFQKELVYRRSMSH